MSGITRYNRAAADDTSIATLSSTKDDGITITAAPGTTKSVKIVESLDTAMEYREATMPAPTMTPDTLVVDAPLESRSTASRSTDDTIDASAATARAARHSDYSDGDIEQQQQQLLSVRETLRFEPLRAQWRYGQAVFARYKKTPYFYSGNIATYLGSNLFMIVFDDGTLNYRVKREDIVLRTYVSNRSDDTSKDADAVKTAGRTESQRSSDSTNADTHRSSVRFASPVSMSQQQAPLSPLQHVHTQWHSNSSIVHQNHMMVDFSVTPPQQIAVYDYSDDTNNSNNAVIDLIGPNDRIDPLDSLDTLDAIKRLECGVGYEDDSTQVSDSDDESNDEDMNVTPWQQMTQTFGMAKLRRRASRRSSISSVSQVERLSLTQKGMLLPQHLLPSPKSLKQTIQDYLSRKTTKKVQPSTGSSIATNSSAHTMAIEHRVQLMETRASELVAKYKADPLFSTRVIVTNPTDGTRRYGTIKTRLSNGDCEVITTDDQTIAVHVLSPDDLDFVPSVQELARQTNDLARTAKALYAGRKVHVNLYPGSRFSGPGVVTLVSPSGATFHVLLHNRIHLLHVPADKLTPLSAKKTRDGIATITDDQFLVCCHKTKVYIGDQVVVQCTSDADDSGGGATGSSSDSSGLVEDKIGILNGVFSNRTAAVDFADGSTGYEISPSRITKRKRLPNVSADLDLLSLKNAVLMQATNGSTRDVLEVGFHVKADHPRKASVETCVVIKQHASSACDVRFSDGMIAFEVFPTQMILDTGVTKRADASVVRGRLHHKMRDASVGDYVLAWSSRFGRYCSAKVAAKTLDDGGDNDSVSLYVVVFDYGEQRTNVPLDRIASIDQLDALAPTQKLTNYSIDTIGFEIQSVTFAVGEAVAARVYGSVQYYTGVVDRVHEKDRVCAVQFDSSERDDCVPFSAMFSVDVRNRSQSISHHMGSSSSSGGAKRLSRFRDEVHSPLGTGAGRDDVLAPSASPRRHRRHSGGSVSSMILSVADLFRPKKGDPTERRGSHVVTEMGQSCGDATHQIHE